MRDDRESEHVHCWHAKRGPIWMVIQDGHVVQACCTCHAVRTVHVEHLQETKHA